MLGLALGGLLSKVVVLALDATLQIIVDVLVRLFDGVADLI